MLPFFAYPLALIALASLPVLAAIYLFRHRFRRRTVSSLLLWRFRLQSREGGSKVQRMQLPLLFLLELLALLLLVAAATGPLWKQAYAGRPLIVVLDDSFSMRAVYEGASSQDRARGFLEKMFSRQPPPTTRVVMAGAQPALAGGPARSWTDLKRLLDRWTCHAPHAALDIALTLASELGNQQANLLVLTDHAPDTGMVAGDRLQWQAFGQPVPNIAVVNASRTSHSDQDRCLLEIANLSGIPRTVGLEVRTGTNSLQTSTLALESNGRQRLIFNIPSGTPLLEAKIDADALSEDDNVELLPPIRQRVRVQLALTNAAASELVAHTLEVTGLRAAISADPELVIHQSEATPSGSNTWGLQWLFTSASAASSFTGPFLIDRTHPLAEGLALQGVVWTASVNVQIPVGAVPIVLAGNTPLLWARVDALGRQQLTLNLDPDLSTLRNTPDWPILFWNLLEWRASEQPGFMQRNVRLGAEVGLQTGGQSVAVTWPDGTAKSFPHTGDRLALETPLPGRYLVAMGTGTSEFVVNTLAAEESSLQDCVTGRWGAWKDEGEQRLQVASAAWMFGLAALGILTLHLVLSAPRKPVSP